jgi:hypothetical protein
MAIGFPPAHRARELDRSRVQQQFLGQRGLTGVWVGNDGEGAAALDFVLERRGADCGFDLVQLLQEFYQFFAPNRRK